MGVHDVPVLARSLPLSPEHTLNSALKWLYCIVCGDPFWVHFFGLSAAAIAFTKADGVGGGLMAMVL